mgnify:CR=1 FL=1
MESLTVDGHVKKGKYVSSHLHFNITYLLEADPEEAVSIKADEKQRCSLVFTGRSIGEIYRTVVCGACLQQTSGKMNDVKENGK